MWVKTDVIKLTVCVLEIRNCYNWYVGTWIGLTNAAIWLVWSFLVRRQQLYVWKAAITITSAIVLLLMELGDFPPIWWTFDAHSLWHAGTILLPLLWYR